MAKSSYLISYCINARVRKKNLCGKETLADVPFEGGKMKSVH